MKARDARCFPPQTVEVKDGSQICFRLLSTEDGDVLGDFYESIPPEDIRFYCPHPLTRERAHEKASRANAPDFICLVAEDDAGAIRGYAWCQWQQGDSTSTFGICVSRTCQGTGVGRTLMKHLLELAQKHAPPTMSLTVQKANPRGIALYQKMGFEIIGEQHRGGDGEPEYYMELTIRRPLP